MITVEMEVQAKRTAERLFKEGLDWVAFYREVLGLRGIVRQMFPTRETLNAFEQTEVYQDILRLLTQLRQRGPVPADSEEPTRMITVRMPKSLHETLRTEAYERRTSINKLCISKLLQFVDGENVPTDL